MNNIPNNQSKTPDSEPVHHNEFRRLWNIYTSYPMSIGQKIELENSLDKVQNEFEHDEFFDFVKGLPGFDVEMIKAIDKLINKVEKIVEEAVVEIKKQEKEYNRIYRN